MDEERIAREIANGYDRHIEAAIGDYRNSPEFQAYIQSERDRVKQQADAYEAQLVKEAYRQQLQDAFLILQQDIGNKITK